MAERSTPRAANPIDAHVGGRVRMRRLLLGMTQEKLSDALGLTFQQVQKYERGQNRISASRLFDVARVLEVPVDYFFDDIPAAIAAGAPAAPATGALPPAGKLAGDPMVGRETLELIRAYYGIREQRVRLRVYELAKALSESSVTAAT